MHIHSLEEKKIQSKKEKIGSDCKKMRKKNKNNIVKYAINKKSSRHKQKNTKTTHFGNNHKTENLNYYENNQKEKSSKTNGTRL